MIVWHQYKPPASTHHLLQLSTDCRLSITTTIHSHHLGTTTTTTTPMPAFSVRRHNTDKAQHHLRLSV